MQLFDGHRVEPYIYAKKVQSAWHVFTMHVHYTVQYIVVFDRPIHLRKIITTIAEIHEIGNQSIIKFRSWLILLILIHRSRGSSIPGHGKPFDTDLLQDKSVQNGFLAIWDHDAN